MFSKRFLFFALLIAGYVLCVKKVCDPNDEKCLTECAVRTYKGFIAGNHGVEPSDPLHVDLIEGDLPTLKYKLTNGSLTGMIKCQVDLAQIFMKNMTYNCIIGCPHLILESNYDVKGKLGLELIEGTGTCKLDIDDYRFVFNGDFEMLTSMDGKMHIQFKNHILENQAETKVNYDCKNLFNGDIEPSDVLHKYANENWLSVHKLIRQPAMEALMKKYVDNVNAFFKEVAFEDLCYRE